MNRTINPDALYAALAGIIELEKLTSPETGTPVAIANLTAKLRMAQLDDAFPLAAEAQEPYDYHADWTRHPDPSGNNDVHWTCNYCEHWTNYPPKARHNCPQATTTPPAPAADPRRLTLDEALVAWNGSKTHAGGLFAVANAQLAKARVTISEAEIRTATSCAWASDSRDRVIALLRSKGVEVTP